MKSKSMFTFEASKTAIAVMTLACPLRLSFATTNRAAFISPGPLHFNNLGQGGNRDLYNECKPKRMVATSVNDGSFSSTEDSSDDGVEAWNDILPFEKASHNSASIVVPPATTEDPGFERSGFQDRLKNTLLALRELDKTSVWVEVPMSRASLIEEMADLGFEFHHANGDYAKLNMWLKDGTESKVPEFATHHVGVGAVVVNSRDEILCVRGLRKNYMPWKIPGGLADLGEELSEAAEREVMEETGIPTRFHSILSFRHTHGLANGRSDLFFVCRLEPIEEVDSDGNIKIPNPTPQECEIAEVQWVPLSEYRDMVKGVNGEKGHPMMSHVIDIYDEGCARIKKKEVKSVVPGRTPSPMYHPDFNQAN